MLLCCLLLHVCRMRSVFVIVALMVVASAVPLVAQQPGEYALCCTTLVRCCSTARPGA
jgi:hypothetical protein